jgi:hypothetical protein
MISWSHYASDVDAARGLNADPKLLTKGTPIAKSEFVEGAA